MVLCANGSGEAMILEGNDSFVQDGSGCQRFVGSG